MAPFLYTVAPTDTSIGPIKKFMKPSVEWREVQKLNRVADPTRLVPGSRLRIGLEWLRADAAVAQVVHAQGSTQVTRDSAALASLPNCAPTCRRELISGAWPALHAATIKAPFGAVQIASDPEFNNLVLDKTFSDPAARVPKPGAGAYYLRVRAIRADGKASGYGPARRFDVEGHPFNPLHLVPFLLFIP